MRQVLQYIIKLWKRIFSFKKHYTRLYVSYSMNTDRVFTDSVVQYDNWAMQDDTMWREHMHDMYYGDDALWIGQGIILNYEK